MGIFSSTNNNNYFSSYIDIKAITAPSSPNSGIGRIFHNSADGKLYFKKSDGTVVDLESGGGGGSGAPTDAQYVTLATNASLSAERVLAGSSPITLTDGGAGSNVTVGFTSTAVKLDDLGTPDDNTDLNASALRHGLLPKLSGNSTDFLTGQGTWAVPAGGGAGGGTFGDTETQDGDASTTIFTIAHGLGVNPNAVSVEASSIDALGDYQVDHDATNITITYQSAPPSGTGNLVWIWIASVGGAGEANTYSNAGAGGVGIVLTKSGVNFPFKSIAAGSSKITVTDDAVNNNVDIDIDEANLSLENIGGTATWSQVSKTGSVLNDIGDVVEDSPAQYDVIQRDGSSQWVGAKITNDNIDASAAIATSKLADSATLLTTTNVKTVESKTIDAVDNILKNLGSHNYEVFKDGTDWIARNTRTGVITSTNTNLTTVLQAAIDALTGSRDWKESVKVFGDGEFGQILIPSYTRLDFSDFHLTVTANTNKSILTNTATPYHSVDNPVLATAATEIEIVGGVFDGNRFNNSDTTTAKQDKNLIYLENVSRAVIINPYIIRPINDGIRLHTCTDVVVYKPYIEDSRSEGLSVVDSSHVTVMNAHITGTGWSFMTTKNSPYTQFIGGYCETNGVLGGITSGINISSTNSYAYGITVIDTTNSGMTLGDNASSTDYDPSGSVVDNCRFENADGPGIRCNTYPARDIKIVNCTMTDSEDRGIALGTNIENFVVSGNIISGCQDAGILVNGSTAAGICRNITITNNIIYNCGKSLSANDHERSAIALYGNDVDTVENIIVENNICYDNQGTQTQKYGVMLRNTNKIQMRFNSLYNNLTDGYLLADTNNNTDNIGNLGHSTDNRLVGTQQANIYGAFTQTFRTGRLRVGNTAFTQFVTLNYASGTNSVDLIVPVLTANDTLVTEAFTQTLTNKTLTSPTINSASMSGTITIPGAVGTPLIFSKTAASGQDSIVRFGVSDDANSYLEVFNATGTDNLFVPTFLCKQQGTHSAGQFIGETSTDTGTQPVFLVTGRVGASTPVATRPIFGIQNQTSTDRLMVWNANNVTFRDAYDIAFNTTTGTKIGTATTQKLSLWGVTPVVQPTTIAAVNSATVDSTYDQDTADVINDLRTKFDDLVTKLKAVGIIATV